jgi:hypothetical protein
MNVDQPRRPAGTPAGGQWAPAAHSEPEVELRSPDSPTTWADRNGQFVLSDGSLGNPGCDECGQEDAVVRHEGRYLCANAARAAGVANPPRAFKVSYTVRGKDTGRIYETGETAILAQDKAAAFHRAIDWAQANNSTHLKRPDIEIKSIEQLGPEP